MPRRPHMTTYFQGRIDHHVNGMMARTVPLPNGCTIVGDVTDQLITVTTRDGTEWHWSGGSYAARKINGCYAPRMPRPVLPR